MRLVHRVEYSICIDNSDQDNRRSANQVVVGCGWRWCVICFLVGRQKEYADNSTRIASFVTFVAIALLLA